ncbi:MAG: hypothetical protein A2Z15_08185 [Chloroflexi bacterium RBG_16_50_11]|nr:MAG: hypothetical protein A2Z15_08185 [Chloroflexi bacterium RBG_16_50_11]
MNSKATIVFTCLVVVLFLVSGGLGYYSFNLNSQVNTLRDDAQVFKTETSNQFSITKESINGVDSKLAGFKTETAGQFTTVQSNITGLDSDLTAFKSDTASKFTATQNSINSLNTELNTELDTLVTQLDESTMNVRRVYDDVIGSVCQIIGNTSSGSGFIYSTDGYIITCWHVINGQTYTDVVLHDGTTKRATVVGSDRDSDIAVIKISGVSNLKPLPLADSSALVAGEPIIVVGNPFGIFETVVYGIISRTKQMVYVSGVGWVSNLIQYDAAQNPGNSGGPVFNGEGQVIGIAESNNTAGEGIKNAVSSNKVKKVADAIIANGSYDNAMLPGTWIMNDLTPEVAIQRTLDSTFGCIFIRVSGITGVQADDIITAVDGIAIRDAADLFSYIAEYKSVGDTVTLSLIRGSGTQIEVSLTLLKGWLER